MILWLILSFLSSKWKPCAHPAHTRTTSSPKRASSPAPANKPSTPSGSSTHSRPVTEGTLVIYLQRPEWGIGIVEWALGDRACASFETPEGAYTDEFAIGELEEAKQAVA